MCGLSAPATPAIMVSTRSVSSSRCDSRRGAWRSARDPKSATVWATRRRPVVMRAVGGLFEATRRARVRDIRGLGELLAVVGEQALGHELQQHVVVALEGGEDVEVCAQPHEAVTGHESGAATGLAGLLQGVERVPGLSGLSAAARVSRSSRSASLSALPLNTASNLTRNSSWANVAAYVVASGAAAGAGAAGSRGSPLRRCRCPR